ncbi:hypothetical protein KIPB_011639, partial [Kipferlia bialata]
SQGGMPSVLMLPNVQRMTVPMAGQQWQMLEAGKDGQGDKGPITAAQQHAQIAQLQQLQALQMQQMRIHQQAQLQQQEQMLAHQREREVGKAPASDAQIPPSSYGGLAPNASVKGEAAENVWTPQEPLSKRQALSADSLPPPPASALPAASLFPLVQPVRSQVGTADPGVLRVHAAVPPPPPASAKPKVVMCDKHVQTTPTTMAEASTRTDTPPPSPIPDQYDHSYDYVPDNDQPVGMDDMGWETQSMDSALQTQEDGETETEGDEEGEGYSERLPLVLRPTVISSRATRMAVPVLRALAPDNVHCASSPFHPQAGRPLGSYAPINLGPVLRDQPVSQGEHPPIIGPDPFAQRLQDGRTEADRLRDQAQPVSEDRLRGTVFVGLRAVSECISQTHTAGGKQCSWDNVPVSKAFRTLAAECGGR